MIQLAMGTEQHPLTETRKRVFLDALAETGSTTAAAQAATPWATHRMGGLSTFKDEARRDPEFADAWDRAEAAALARVESEVMRRAMTPTLRPVFSQGELKCHVEEYDNRLLLAVARRLNPDAWADRRKVEQSGRVEHTHMHAHAVAQLEPRDLLYLAPTSRQQLLGLLEQIAAAKGEPARELA